MCRPERGRGEAGVAAVELAIILPFLALLLIGTIEMGLVVRDHQALQNAAREAARFSALPDNKIANAIDPDQVRTNIESVVIAYLANDGIALTSPSITISQTEPMTIGGLSVTGSLIEITYDRPLLFGLMDSLGFSDFDLYGDALFRNFYGTSSFAGNVGPSGTGPVPTDPLGNGRGRGPVR